jgi:hypothetical protein
LQPFDGARQRRVGRDRKRCARRQAEALVEGRKLGRRVRIVLRIDEVDRLACAHLRGLGRGHRRPRRRQRRQGVRGADLRRGVRDHRGGAGVGCDAGFGPQRQAALQVSKRLHRRAVTADVGEAWDDGLPRREASRSRTVDGVDIARIIEQHRCQMEGRVHARRARVAGQRGAEVEHGRRRRDVGGCCYRCVVGRGHIASAAGGEQAGAQYRDSERNGAAASGWKSKSSLHGLSVRNGSRATQ